MRHRKAGYKLGRTTAHRLSTMRLLTMGLLQHGQITTTVTKAKAVQPFVERIITLAKRGDLNSRRQVVARLGGDKKAFDWLYLPKKPGDAEKERVERLRTAAAAYFPVPESSSVERNRYGEIRKAPRIIKHLFENVAPRFQDRAGGYTRIVKLGVHRVGDAGELAVLQFVGAEEGPEIGGRASTRRRTADRRTAYAKQARKPKESAPAAGAEAAST